MHGDLVGGGGATSGSINVSGSTTINVPNLGTKTSNTADIVALEITGAITGGPGKTSGSINTNSDIRSATLHGDLAGGDGPSSGSINAQGNLDTIKILGNAAGGNGGPIRLDSCRWQYSLRAHRHDRAFRPDRRLGRRQRCHLQRRYDGNGHDRRRHSGRQPRSLGRHSGRGQHRHLCRRHFRHGQTFQRQHFRVDQRGRRDRERLYRRLEHHRFHQGRGFARRRSGSEFGQHHERRRFGQPHGRHFAYGWGRAGQRLGLCGGFRHRQARLRPPIGSSPGRAAPRWLMALSRARDEPLVQLVLETPSGRDDHRA